MDTFSIIEKILKETEEYYFYITNETLITVSGIKQSLRALDNGVQGRGIRQTGFTQPRIISDNIPEEVWKAIRSHEAKGSLENRYLECIDFCLFMSEKEALFDFPDNVGNFDYIGFTSTEEKAIEWCKDVFNYYWERSRLINSV